MGAPARAWKCQVGEGGGWGHGLGRSVRPLEVPYPLESTPTQRGHSRVGLPGIHLEVSGPEARGIYSSFSRQVGLLGPFA